MVDASYIASAVSALGPSLSGLDIESKKEIEIWEERINTNQGEVSDLKVSKDWRCAIEDIAGCWAYKTELCLQETNGNQFCTC